MRAFGTTLEKVRAQTFQAIALASGGKAAEQPSPKNNVVTCRIDGRDLDAVDALIEAGICSTRSDAATWLIHAGIEANRPLFEKVYGNCGRDPPPACSGSIDGAGSGRKWRGFNRIDGGAISIESHITCL